jgi:CDP-diacylglycerol--glycerol-3-phosphate 3-phosphatidyltransferase
MKNLANVISIMRIFLVLVLIFIKPLSALFYVIYIISGLSDMADGRIARKTNTTSRLGEKLDSIADFIMVAVMIIIYLPLIQLEVQMIIVILVIGCIRVISITVVLTKYKIFGILHTYANKLTGLLLFILPLLMPFLPIELLIYGVCVIAGISAIEELLIHILSTTFDANKKSIIIK